MATTDAMNADARIADKVVREAIKADTAFYKALLVLARIDKSKVEDSTDKMVVMRALRILHSIQEINADKSLDRARI